MQFLRLAGVMLLASACGGGGGGGTDAMVDATPADASPPDATPPDAGWLAPALRNPVDLPDDVLATQALTLLGAEALGAPENCQACHAMTRQEIRWWRALTDTSAAECLTDLDVQTPDSAQAMIECFRQKPGAPFQTAKLGVFATGAHLDWFQFLFNRAVVGPGDADHAAFVERVLMPKGTHPPFTQGEFDIVIEWFLRGVPMLDELLPEDPPPTSCLDGVSADVGIHAGNMATMGWKAINEDAGMLMYGCAGAATPLDCLAAHPRAGDQAYSVGWEVIPGSKLRILREYAYESAYWTRSSADGRFIGHGAYVGGLSSMILDLQEDRQIPVDAYYDPGFFPDNSGFVWQGGGAHFCPLSVLTASPDDVTLDEPGCSTNSVVGLYEHVGASLGGGDYWAINGDFVSDDGGHSATLQNPAAWFGGGSDQKITRLINTGTAFMPQSSTFVDTPFEADAVISPSGQLMVNRVAGPGSAQIGFVLRRIDMTPQPGGGFDVTLPEVARYCFSGGKPGFSYDERYMTIHHYVTDADAVEMGFTGPSDPAFAPYRTQGAANVYLIDLVTGARTRITSMQPGQYALFPHFRNDGWIYFIVRRPATSNEIAVASDAALVIGTP